MRKVLILFIVAGLAVLAAAGVQAAAPGPDLPGGGLQTPVPTAAETAAGGTGVPWLGIGVMLAVAGLVIWKTTRPELSSPAKAGACLPVIDEAAEARMKARLDALEETEKEAKLKV